MVCESDAVVEWEEGIRCKHEAFGNAIGMSLFECDFGRTDTIHLTCTYAKCFTIFNYNDSVRFHMFHDAETEVHIVDFSSSCMFLCHCHRIYNFSSIEVHTLSQETTINAHILHRHCCHWRHRHLDKTKIFLSLEKFQCLRSKLRSHDDFEEDRLHELSHFESDFAVSSHDTTKDTYCVSFIRLSPCFNYIFTHSSTTRIHVFQAYTKWHIEFTHDRESSIGILDIIVAHLFTMQLTSKSQ